MDQFLECSRVMGCNQSGGVWLPLYYFQEAELNLNALPVLFAGKLIWL
jgi:hypothetical protein